MVLKGPYPTGPTGCQLRVSSYRADDSWCYFVSVFRGIIAMCICIVFTHCCICNNAGGWEVPCSRGRCAWLSLVWWQCWPILDNPYSIGNWHDHPVISCDTGIVTIVKAVTLSDINMYCSLSTSTSVRSHWPDKVNTALVSKGTILYYECPNKENEHACRMVTLSKRPCKPPSYMNHIASSQNRISTNTPMIMGQDLTSMKINCNLLTHMKLIASPQRFHTKWVM